MAVSQAGEVLGSCCSSYFQLESCCKFIFVKVALYKKSGTSVLNFVFVTCLSLPTWSILLVKLLFRCTLFVLLFSICLCSGVCQPCGNSRIKRCGYPSSGCRIPGSVGRVVTYPINLISMSTSSKKITELSSNVIIYWAFLPSFLFRISTISVHLYLQH